MLTASDLIRAVLDLDVERVRALVDAGADVSSRSTGRRTALHAAASVGSVDAARLLLEAGAEVEPRDWMGETPLHYAARYGRGGDLMDPDPEFRVVFDAPRKMHPDVAAALAAELRERLPALPPTLRPEDPIPEGRKAEVIAEALRMLGGEGPGAVYDLLTRRGVDVGRVDPVFANELLRKPGCLGVARLLLEHGADPNAVSDGGETPLYEAAGVGEPEMVELLVRHGADVDHPGDGWHLPLGNAIEYRRLDLLEALHRAGARLESDTLLPLHVAAGMGLNAEIIGWLLARGVDVRRADEDGDTALMRAAAADDARSVEQLLAAGADPAARNHEGMTALHVAAREGAPDAAAALIRAGADVNVRAQDGRTPLHVFVDQDWELLGHESENDFKDWSTQVRSVPRLLVASGADVTLRDAQGRTAPEVAKRKGYPADLLARAD